MDAQDAAAAENRLTNDVFLHILFSRSVKQEKNAENGKSSFLEGVRERMPAAVSILRGKKSKVHPGAGRLKTYYCG